jgi:hypothetical protein
VLGFFVLGWWLGPALLGYDGPFAADMTISALPFLALLWLLCFPFFLLFGAAIEVIGTATGLLKEKIDLR